MGPESLVFMSPSGNPDVLSLPLLSLDYVPVSLCGLFVSFQVWSVCIFLPFVIKTVCAFGFSLCLVYSKRNTDG